MLSRFRMWAGGPNAYAGRADAYASNQEGVTSFQMQAGGPGAFAGRADAYAGQYLGLILARSVADNVDIPALLSSAFVKYGLLADDVQLSDIKSSVAFFRPTISDDVDISGVLFRVSDFVRQLLDVEWARSVGLGAQTLIRKFFGGSRVHSVVYYPRESTIVYLAPIPGDPAIRSLISGNPATQSPILGDPSLYVDILASISIPTGGDPPVVVSIFGNPLIELLTPHVEGE